MIRERLLALDGDVRGALWLLLAAATFSCLNSVIKALGVHFPTVELVFFRSLFGTIVLLPMLLLPEGRQALRVERPDMHLYRIALGLGAMTLSFAALAELPLAGAISLFFTKPLFIIVLAAMFLGQRPRWRRSLATLAGFGGVLIMLRPWQGTVDIWALTAVGSAFLMASVTVVIKSMTASERPLTMVLYFSLGCTIGTLPASLLVWRWPDTTELGLLALMGLLGSLAQYFIARAYHAGEATAITPMDYSQLIFAGAMGYWVFGEIPDLWTITGGAILVAASWYVVRRTSAKA